MKNLLILIPTLLLNMNVTHFDEVDSTNFISIRHDKKDAEYINLGKKYKAVGKVGVRGGDGTLIASNWIITAAHVAEGMYRRKGNDLKVYFDNREKGYAIDKIFIHSSFSPMQQGDIALIKLKQNVAGIKPMELYKDRDELGKQIVIVGHGDFKTGIGGKWKVDGIKRAATNIIDEVTDSVIVFDFDSPETATDLEGTAGRGDSGGPAIIYKNGIPKIAGISSAGRPGKNGPGTYGAIENYTRVSTYVNWIQKVILNPNDNKSLTDVNSKQRRGTSRKSGNKTIKEGVIEGLGLIVRQENDNIRIGGKIDPKVPQEFRHVLFKPPSFIESFNGKKYTSLSQLKKDFNKVKKGDSFSIQFLIQGNLKSFKVKKL